MEWPVKIPRKIDWRTERTRYSIHEGITKRPVEGFKIRGDITHKEGGQVEDQGY